jgi:hypothetical protein
MAVVAAIAVNLAVMRSLDWNAPNTLPHLFFACGVMPMGSLLAIIAMTFLPRAPNGQRLSSFVFGFETLGWISILAFVALYSLTPSAILAVTEKVGAYTRPILGPLFEGSPGWAAAAGELGFGTVLFSLPELVIALLGGWLARKVGVTARIEIGAGKPATSAEESMAESCSAHFSSGDSFDS